MRGQGPRVGGRIHPETDTDGDFREPAQRFHVAPDGAHVQAGDVAYLARLVALDRRQALDPVAYDVMEIDPAPGEWPFGRGRE